MEALLLPPYLFFVHFVNASGVGDGVAFVSRRRNKNDLSPNKGATLSHLNGWEKVVQSVQTEPKGYPKLYIGTARGEVCAEQNA